MSACKRRLAAEEWGMEPFSKWLTGTCLRWHGRPGTWRGGCIKGHIAHMENIKVRGTKLVLQRRQKPPQLGKVRQRGGAAEQG